MIKKMGRRLRETFKEVIVPECITLMKVGN
jgi:hypothetical protein